MKPPAHNEILISIHSEPGFGKGILLDAIKKFLASKGIISICSNEHYRALGEYTLRIDTDVNNIDKLAN